MPIALASIGQRRFQQKPIFNGGVTLMNTSSRDVLNQPFKFVEVLMDTKERRRMQSAIERNKAFEGDTTCKLDANTPTRELAVRLRTINNACSAPFCMANGIQITEVSLYGSRDRQYLVGPFWAVEHLMKGALPWDSRQVVEEHVERSAAILESELNRINRFLQAPSSFSEADRQADRGSQHDGRGKIPLEEHRREALEDFSKRMQVTLEELRAIRTNISGSAWWWSWTTDCTATQERLKELGTEYQSKRAVFWPRVGPNSGQRRMFSPQVRCEDYQEWQVGFGIHDPKLCWSQTD